MNLCDICLRRTTVFEDEGAEDASDQASEGCDLEND